MIKLWFSHTNDWFVQIVPLCIVVSKPMSPPLSSSRICGTRNNNSSFASCLLQCTNTSEEESMSFYMRYFLQIFLLMTTFLFWKKRCNLWYLCCLLLQLTLYTITFSQTWRISFFPSNIYQVDLPNEYKLINIGII